MKNELQLRSSVQSYCAKIGCDSLLVQGAGGNVSWKENGILWIKASGTWLKNALDHDIFVSVDLLKLNASLVKGDYSLPPVAMNGSALRPSIETLLHGLMPQTVVVHLHPIEVLSWLVRYDHVPDLKRILAGIGFSCVTVDYQKPGADLARRVAIALKENYSIDIVFMANHGIVIGGESVREVDHKLKKLLKILSIQPLAPVCEKLDISFAETHPGYIKIDDPGIQQLALDDRLFGRLNKEWALYPDHLVFLGPKPFIANSWPMARLQLINHDDLPEIVFIKDLGVFSCGNLSAAKQAQLRCYYDVLTRQSPNQELAVLDPIAVSNLLNWDAEIYRQSISK